jgi:phospholipase/carboxylesterase
MNNDKNALHYLYRPAKEKSAAKSPVIILLHGVGSNELDLFELSESFDPRYAVYSLRAPLVLGANAFAWFHVNFTEQGPIHNREEAEASRGILKNFIKNLGNMNSDIDPQQIYILGFSQGTIMGLSLALTEPELIKGLVAISGRTLQEVSAQAKERTYEKSPRVLLLHGINDGKLLFSQATNTEEVLKNAKFDYEFKKYEAGHQITPEMLRDIQQWLKQQR